MADDVIPAATDLTALERLRDPVLAGDGAALAALERLDADCAAELAALAARDAELPIPEDLALKAARADAAANAELGRLIDENEARAERRARDRRPVQARMVQLRATRNEIAAVRTRGAVAAQGVADMENRRAVALLVLEHRLLVREQEKLAMRLFLALAQQEVVGEEMHRRAAIPHSINVTPFGHDVIRQRFAENLAATLGRLKPYALKVLVPDDDRTWLERIEAERAYAPFLAFAGDQADLATAPADSAETAAAVRSVLAPPADANGDRGRRARLLGADAGGAAQRPLEAAAETAAPSAPGE